MSPLSQRAWLDHLALLAELPYPSATLMPSILQTVRAGMQADMATYGWVEGEHLQPTCFWAERMDTRAFNWFMREYENVFAEVPLRGMLDSDGEVIRQVMGAPGFEESPLCMEVLSSQGLRWGCCAPVKRLDGHCMGFMYQYRSAEAGPFSDREQALLHAARDRLRTLDQASGPYTRLPPCTERVALSHELLLFDMNGTMQARSGGATHRLYLAHGAHMGMLAWARADLEALPDAIREDIRFWLRQAPAQGRKQWQEERISGQFQYQAECLPTLGTPAQPLLAVTIGHSEPTDLRVARNLLHWPMSPQEKRIVIASASKPTLVELAAALGLTVGTLKSYVNRLQSRFGVDTRAALVEAVLRQAQDVIARN